MTSFLRQALICIGIAATAAACTPTPTPVASPSANAAAAPGSQVVSSEAAGRIFKSACVDPYPAFSGTPSALNALGLVQNKTTGTYFHPQLDLSVKLLRSGSKRICSMVFASREQVTELGILLTVAAGTKGKAGQSLQINLDPDTGAGQVELIDGRMMQFTPAGQHAGKSYYRAAMGL